MQKGSTCVLKNSWRDRKRWRYDNTGVRIQRDRWALLETKIVGIPKSSGQPDNKSVLKSLDRHETVFLLRFWSPLKRPGTLLPFADRFLSLWRSFVGVLPSFF